MADYQSIFTGEQIDAGVQAGLNSVGDLQRVTGLLQGTEANARASNNPFVKLGDYDSWDAANAALTALLATRENECLKYTGRLRFSVQGANFEAYMFIRNVSTPTWVQVVSGAVQANAAGTALEHSARYATFIRDCNGATISAWEEAYATLAELEQVRLTALGLGSEKPLDAAVTCISSSTVGRLFPRWTGEADKSLNGWLNDLFVTLDRDPKYNGYYIIKRGNYPQLGSLQVGGYVRATGVASCTQIIRGNFALTSGPDAGGYAWSEHGITNRLITADHVIGEWYRTSRRNADGTFSVTKQWTQIFYSN